MTIDQVTKLLEAGFSKDEIMSFQQNTQENPQPENPNIKPEQENNSTDKEEKNPSDQQEPTADQADAQDKNPNIPELDTLNQSINKLIKTIQASNLQNNFTGSSGNVDINKQVDDIMKSIIRPEKKGD